MADNSIRTPGSGESIATDEATYSGDTAKVQIVRLVDVTGSEGSKTIQTPRFVMCSADVTRPADTTAYTVNDALSNSTSAPTSGGFTFANAAAVSGGAGIITDAIVATSVDTGIGIQGELWIFDRAVTNINDNAAFAISDSEVKTCIGKIPFSVEDIGNNWFYHAQNLNIGFVCNGSADLRFLIRVRSAYSPGNAEVFTFVLKIQQLP